MNVKNRACIRKLSLRSLGASRKRNSIAIVAIALTAMLFTALFTVALSINSSYQTYTFRQIGGYSHGSFKDVTEEQIEAIAAHPKVRQVGERRVIGMISEGAFAKKPAEVSYMDENCTRWSYATPTVGRMPQSAKEISMDTEALALLGVEPALNKEVRLSYVVGDKEQVSFEKTDTFILVGYWEHDDIIPVHYINVSRDYADQIEARGMEEGMNPFKVDLSVMMASDIGIRSQMEQVDMDLGYTWEDRNGENVARIGVNWGYTTEQIGEHIDMGTLMGMVLILMVIVFTGYLIIYNIFQISVSSDIRYYGLLKTIGVTPRQLRRMIRWQALSLSAIGIPIGLLAGFGIGAALSPFIVKSINETMTRTAIATSPLMFVIATFLTLFTVLISCKRPGRLAAKVSPVEATKYTEQAEGKKKNRKTQGAGIRQMALANLYSNPGKTGIVIVSLAFAVVLLNLLYAFVGGFDMEKYLQKQICGDFIVSSSHYFRYEQGVQEYLPENVIYDIKEHTDQTLSGSGYTIAGHGYDVPQAWMTEEAWLSGREGYLSEEDQKKEWNYTPKRGKLMAENALIEGLDDSLFEKLTVLDGDLYALNDTDAHNIAVVISVDDYGNPIHQDMYPVIGDKLTITYVNDAYFIDSRTGEPCDDTTPDEYLQYVIADGKDVEYTVVAYVLRPYSMGFRYGTFGYDLILPVEKMREDSEQTLIPMFYLFDTSDQEAELAAEQYLAEITSHDSNLMYESKDTLRKDFEGFQKMFLLVGGLLCGVIGVIGVLNFFNGIMTGILSRKREFAVLQAVGMTNQQLRTMLILEGMIYTAGASGLAALLSLLLNPLVSNAMEFMFWFFRPRFTILPVLLSIPIFLVLGWAIPSALYGQTVKHSVVERLREIG